MDSLGLAVRNQLQVRVEGVELNLVDSGHNRGLGQQLFQNLLREVTDANGLALRSDEWLHQFPRLDESRAVVFSQRLVLGGRSRRPRPVHEEDVDVV